MSKKMGELWEADPHTIAKITILKAYLNAWFPILGRTHPGETILYVDGFAGPGEYANGIAGSPVAALDCAELALNNSGAAWIAGDIHCVFVEQDDTRYAHLQTITGNRPVRPGIRSRAMKGEFVDAIAELEDQLPAPFRTDSPLFVFIDPFGAKGVPFDVVARILSSRTSEVLINFDADGVARIYEAGVYANHEAILDTVFGGLQWRDYLQDSSTFPQRCQRAAELYMQRLRSIPGVRYVFRFEMRDRADRISYYLIFASREPLGLEKMKEAMRSVDKSGRYCFSDGNVGQEMLFRFDDPREHAFQMHASLAGRRIGWEELQDYILNHTPFTRPSIVLQVLEGEQMITVVSAGKRRRRQFTSDTIVSVEFVPKPKDLFGGY